MVYPSKNGFFFIVSQFFPKEKGEKILFLGKAKEERRRKPWV
jgi:hypothetical protein